MRSYTFSPKLLMLIKEKLVDTLWVSYP